MLLLTPARLSPGCRGAWTSFLDAPRRALKNDSLRCLRNVSSYAASFGFCKTDPCPHLLSVFTALLGGETQGHVELVTLPQPIPRRPSCPASTAPDHRLSVSLLLSREETRAQRGEVAPVPAFPAACAAAPLGSSVHLPRGLRPRPEGRDSSLHPGPTSSPSATLTPQPPKSSHLSPSPPLPPKANHHLQPLGTRVLPRQKSKKTTPCSLCFYSGPPHAFPVQRSCLSSEI